MLLLFDIDGTLLSGPTSEHSMALRTALRDVHGLSETQAHIPVEEAGRTDGQIVRTILTTAGVDTSTIDGRTTDVQTAACRHYEALCPPDLSDRVIPGISELLISLSARAGIQFSLVTGNFEPIARLKLDRAGLGSWFATGQGGFGSDAEDRGRLPAIARRRAGGDSAPFPRDQTIVIGDTPRDIACARADGVRCIAVTSGSYLADELAAADAVATDGTLGAVLTSMLDSDKGLPVSPVSG